MKRILLAIVIGLAWASLAVAQATFVQSPVPTGCNSCTSNTIAFAVNEGGGHLVMVYNVEVNTLNVNPTVSDSAGNTLVHIYSNCTNVGARYACQDMWASCNSVAGANTFTITQPASGTNAYMATTAIEYSGVTGTQANACVNIKQLNQGAGGCTGGCFTTVTGVQLTNIPANTLYIGLEWDEGAQNCPPTTNLTNIRACAKQTGGSSTGNAIISDLFINAAQGSEQATWTWPLATGSNQSFQVGFGGSGTKKVRSQVY